MRLMAIFSKFIALLGSLALALTANLARADAVDNELAAALRSALNQPNSFADPYIGQVWLASMTEPLSRWLPDAQQRLILLTQIHQEAVRVGLEPGLVLALIQVESAFDPYAISYAGARGMMQIMPFWKQEIGRENDNLMDTATNLRYGTTILAHYLRIEDGSLVRALARYNGSRGQTWYPKRVLTYWRNYWRLSD